MAYPMSVYKNKKWSELLSAEGANCEKIKTLEDQDGNRDATYLVLMNECRYLENLHKGIKVIMVENQLIIKDLQSLYLE